MEMNFCRRCGHALKNDHDHIYSCSSGHTIFNNSSPATAIIFINQKHQAMFSVRGINPGKGKLDFPGGFCDGAETLEDSLLREIKEELNLLPTDYSTPTYLTSSLDDYSYGGEVIKVLCGIFWAHLKHGAKIKPTDDVADVVFLDYKEANDKKATMQWPEQFRALDQLHNQGII